MKNVFATILWILPLISIGQSIPFSTIQNDLAQEFGKFRLYSDSNEIVNAIIIKKFKYYLHEYPATLTYPFKFEDTIGGRSYKYCNVVTSPDTQFRIYSWDDQTGGTRRSFVNLLQFKSGNSIYTADFNDLKLKSDDDGGDPYSVFMLKTDTSIYYLVLSHYKYSSPIYGQKVRIYGIRGNSLTNPKLIRTAKGLTSYVSIEYNIFDLNGNHEPVNTFTNGSPIIKYDPEQKTIFVRVIFENGRGTDRYITYQFNGEYFEKVTAKK